MFFPGTRFYLSRPRLRGGSFLASRVLSRPARPQKVANQRQVKTIPPLRVAWGGLWGGRFQDVDDRRRFHPSGVDRPVRTARGLGVRLVPKSRGAQREGVVPAALAFGGPSSVLICMRRQRRRQVLNALGVAGRSGLRPPTRNWTSEISCREA